MRQVRKKSSKVIRKQNQKVDTQAALKAKVDTIKVNLKTFLLHLSVSSSRALAFTIVLHIYCPLQGLRLASITRVHIVTYNFVGS